MPDPLFDVGAESLGRMALKNAREAHVNVDVAPRAKRAAGVAPLPIPWLRDLMRKVRTPNLTLGISATAACPFLSDISRQLRQTIFEGRKIFGGGRRSFEGGCVREGASLRAASGDRAERLLLRSGGHASLRTGRPWARSAVTAPFGIGPEHSGRFASGFAGRCPCILSAPRPVGDHQTALECSPYP